jgi:hypothetical protein
MAIAIYSSMVLSILRCMIMNRLLTTGAALSVLLGTTGLALAQNNPAPYYSGAPAYSQPMPPQQAAVPQPYPQPYAQTAPSAYETHSGGSGDRAYYHGQKTN